MKVDNSGYQLEDGLHPLTVKALSATTQEISVACFQNVLMSEICRAAMWSNLLMFVKRYALKFAVRSDGTFSSTVLKSLSDTAGTPVSHSFEGVLRASPLPWYPH